MGGFFRKLLLTGALTLCVAAGYAQKVNFEVAAPTMVAMGEVFRVEFTVTAKPDDFKQPTFKGFEVLAGPTASYGQYTNIDNGNITQTEIYTYTYVLQPSAEGRQSISAAEVKVGGKSYSTQPVTIEVVKEASQGAAAEQSAEQGRRKPRTIAADDILINASVNNQTVFKGQPVRLTLKLYRRLPLSGVSGTKLPAFNGFWSQELPQNTSRQWQRENYNGKVYDAIIIGEYLLYPQQSGTLQIDPFELTAVAQIITQQERQSLLDDFFSGGPNVQEVQKELRTRAITVTVKEFPAGAPTSFSGAVGEFSMDPAVSSRTIAANSAATYTLKISGSGNLPLIQAPKLSLPGSFEQYNIKTTESLSSNSFGTSGYRQFEYPFIARAEGVHTIEPVEFTYFNPSTARYVTLTAPEVELTITPDTQGGARTQSTGIVSGLTKEDIKILGSDIRFIKIGAPGFVSVDFLAIGSYAYFAAVALIFILGVSAYQYVLRRRRIMGDAALVKGRRANKMALQRFRAAEKFKSEGDRRRFLEEMLRALWGYMGDKLNIPAANLTKDNVRDELAKRGVPQQRIERYTDVISACEMAQYSPETTGQADELYCNGVEIVSDIESSLR